MSRTKNPKTTTEIKQFLRHAAAHCRFGSNEDNTICDATPADLDAAKILEELREESKRYAVSCNQCEAVMINGVFCHETGCPNSGARLDVELGEWIKQRVCGECGCTVDADDPCCNAQDRESYTDNQDRDSYTTDLEESEEQE